MSDSAAKEVTRVAAEAKGSAKNGGGPRLVASELAGRQTDTNAHTGEIDALLNTDTDTH